jgi:hypothetical protein
MISTWILIITLNGSSPSWPLHTFKIDDMPSQQECQRVSVEISHRFSVRQGLCVEVKKVKQ